MELAGGSRRAKHIPVGAISALVLLEQISAASRAEPRGGLEGARQTQLAASFPKHPRQGIIAVNFWVQLGLAARENVLLKHTV